MSNRKLLLQLKVSIQETFRSITTFRKYIKKVKTKLFVTLLKRDIKIKLKI